LKAFLATAARLGGPAAVLGGLLWAAGILAGELDGRSFGPPDALFLAASPLMLVGLLGLYARYGRQTRGMGRTGFAQATAGLVLLAVALAASLLTGGDGAARAASFGLIILALGLSLVGLESLKHRLLPRWNALPLVMGLLIPLATVAGAVGPLRPLLSAAFGLAWLPLGYLILLGARREDG
jgi:hypothetical protein